MPLHTYGLFLLAAAPLVAAAELPRDGALLADPGSRTYYLYASDQGKVIAYQSRDLSHWDGPSVVLSASGEHPRVERYRGTYCLFLTVSDGETTLRKPPESWQAETARGVQLFLADSPLGPFAPAGRPLTPAAFMTNDGSLFVEGDIPWLVYVHDSHQLIDANIEALRLKADLSPAADDPLYLFKASDAPWLRDRKTTSIEPRIYPAFSPALHRTGKGSLLMLWSSQDGAEIRVTVARSLTGEVRGPWRQEQVLARADSAPRSGIVRTFDGRLVLPLVVRKRPALVELLERGDSLSLKLPMEPQ